MYQHGKIKFRNNRQKNANLLLIGYLRNPENLAYTMITGDIIDSICMEYYLQRIDYFKPNYGAMVHQNYNSFQSDPLETDSTYGSMTYCISQYPWNKGHPQIQSLGFDPIFKNCF